MFSNLRIAAAALVSAVTFSVPAIAATVTESGDYSSVWKTPTQIAAGTTQISGSATNGDHDVFAINGLAAGAHLGSHQKPGGAFQLRLERLHELCRSDHSACRPDREQKRGAVPSSSLHRFRNGCKDSAIGDLLGMWHAGGPCPLHFAGRAHGQTRPNRRNGTA